MKDIFLSTLQSGKRNAERKSGAFWLAAWLAAWGVGAAGAMGWRGSKEPTATAVFDQTYDPGREVTFEGKIMRVDPAPCVALPVSSQHVHLAMAQDKVEVHLGPCWYILNQKPLLREGDIISGVGSEASWKSGDRRVIQAREIRRGKEVLRLRDQTGKPLWRD
jgi:hypothetical protein